MLIKVLKNFIQDAFIFTLFNSKLEYEFDYFFVNDSFIQSSTAILYVIRTLSILETFLCISLLYR